MFCIQQSQKGTIESKALNLYSVFESYPCVYFQKTSEVERYATENPLVKPLIPVGTIQWFKSVTKWDITPNYYPDFLHQYLGRKVWQTSEWPLNEKVFIKPADVPKRFDGFVTRGGYHKKKRGPYWCSEVVTFVNEWRYYISGGKIVYARWYLGLSGEEVPVPELNIDWPSEWVGSVDFGLTNDGRLLLIEAHEPYSVGWYGTLNDYKIYAQWLRDGFEYMTKIRNLE